MCGLAGTLGPNINLGSLRALMFLNQQRGDDACGFYNTNKEANWIKNNVKAEIFLRDEKLRKWLEQSAKHCWAICGHTRGGTRGGNFSKNAHPFEYGEVVGSHNGVLACPAKYTVDSEYAIDLLSQHEPGEYQKALGDVEGWYVLTWYDRRDDSIYLLNWQGEIWFRCMEDGQVLYSSSAWHLSSVTGYDKAVRMDSGDVFRFRYGKNGKVLCKRMPDFTGKKREFVQHQNQGGWQQRGNYGDAENYSRQSYGTYTPPKGKNYWDPTGWVRKFKDKKWYAELYNTRYARINDQGQEWLNKRFQHAADCHQASLYTELAKLESFLAKFAGSVDGFKQDDTELENPIKIEPTDKSTKALSPSQLKTEMEQEEAQKNAIMDEVLSETERFRKLMIRRQALQNEGKSDDEIEQILISEKLMEPDLVGIYD
jgi:hypothetical protein